jgi:hypothetical protein
MTMDNLNIALGGNLENRNKTRLKKAYRLVWIATLCGFGGTAGNIY